MATVHASNGTIVLVAVVALGVVLCVVAGLTGMLLWRQSGPVPDWFVGVALLAVRELGDVVSRYVQQSTVTQVQRQAQEAAPPPPAATP